MADKRMFSASVIVSDKFIDMSASARALYFDFCIRADDEGFITSPKMIARSTGAGEPEIQELIDSGFIIRFDDGNIVITHWLVHNRIKQSRITPTICTQDRALLLPRWDKSCGTVPPSEPYVLIKETIGIPSDGHMTDTCPTNGDQLPPQIRGGMRVRTRRNFGSAGRLPDIPLPGISGYLFSYKKRSPAHLSERYRQSDPLLQRGYRREG